MGEASDLLYEREVTIRFSDAEETAYVYAASPAWMRKFDRFCEENPSEFRAVEDSTENGRVIGRFYEFPKKLITIRAKSKTLDLTDEQRAVLSERGRQNRAKQLEKQKDETTVSKICRAMKALQITQDERDEIFFAGVTRQEAQDEGT